MYQSQLFSMILPLMAFKSLYNCPKTLPESYLTNFCGYPAEDRTSVWTNWGQSINKHSKINAVHTIAVRTPGYLFNTVQNVLTYGSVLPECYLTVIRLRKGQVFAGKVRESVDSLYRDGADAQYKQYLSKSRITSPQTRKKLI